MKRVFALILALCMACALFACGKKQTEVAPGPRTREAARRKIPAAVPVCPAVQAVPEMPETAEIPPAVPAAAGPAPGWR